MKPNLTQWKGWQLFLAGLLLHFIPRITGLFLGRFVYLTYELFYWCSVFAVMLWFWQTSSLLNLTMKKEVKLNYSKFKICFIVTTMSTILLEKSSQIIRLICGVNTGYSVISSDPFQILKLSVTIAIAVGWFYLSYYIGRGIKTVESKTTIPLKIGDYFLYVLITFFLKFGGIFFVQPKINKIAIESNNLNHGISNQLVS